MKRDDLEPHEAHYHTTGWAMIVIGCVMLMMATIMICLGHSQQDHFANASISLIVILTGVWLRSHNEDDMT